MWTPEEIRSQVGNRNISQSYCLTLIQYSELILPLFPSSRSQTSIRARKGLVDRQASRRLTSTDQSMIYKTLEREDVSLMYGVSVRLFESCSPLTAANSQRKQERPEQLGVGTDILFRRRSPSSLT